MKELVTFDVVLQALKRGAKAQRISWKGTNHFIYPHMQERKEKQVCVGLMSSLNGIDGACALHNNDLLADDWEVFDDTAAAQPGDSKQS